MAAARAGRRTALAAVAGAAFGRWCAPPRPRAGLLPALGRPRGAARAAAPGPAGRRPGGRRGAAAAAGVRRRAAAPDLELLSRPGAATNDAIRAFFGSGGAFQELAERELAKVARRDREDAEKLLRGTRLAVERGLLPDALEVEPVRRIQVQGRGVDAQCSEIIQLLGDAPATGCVVTLQGLSGTGKGTTVSRLKELLPNATTWSNGNLFRSLALLAGAYAEKHGVPLEKALEPDVMASLVEMLEFDDFGNGFDVKIDGLGMKYMVSDIELTVLKQVKDIPTVAAATQGEVINFVQGALDTMSGAGTNVILEGREQTLRYIRTPHRFELYLDDPLLVGQRQAAMRVGAEARERLLAGAGEDPATVLHEVLSELLGA